jgi:hydrocephalus-inducing protein
MVFEYTPTSDVLVESFWCFSIPSQGLVIPFLLVGHVTEPRVTLDRPAINFGRVRGSPDTQQEDGLSAAVLPGGQ